MTPVWGRSEAAGGAVTPSLASRSIFGACFQFDPQYGIPVGSHLVMEGNLPPNRVK
jgi:hypothetical protein